MSSSIRAGLIVVLFRPGEDELANVARARRQGLELLVVDNSYEADATVHEKLAADGVEVLWNRNAGGLAGAYNRGTERLLAAGCQLVFLLDQDSVIPDDFFARMLDGVRGMEDTAFLVGPRVYEVRADRYLDSLPLPGTHPVRSELQPARMLISSGSGFSAAAYRRLGPFREDFFIEMLDVEYCLRAAAHGVPIYVNTTVELRQTTGETSAHGTRSTTNHSPERRYYLSRNCVYAARLHSSRRWSYEIFAYPLGEARLVLALEDDKLRKLVGIGCGLYDGVRGRLGRWADQHPRLSAYGRGERRRTRA